MMDDSSGLARAVAFSIAGYPVYLARTLIQIGYEPIPPDEYGRLPNIFSYISIIRRQGGYSALYTGLNYHLFAVVVKKSSYDAIVDASGLKQDTSKNLEQKSASEVVATCMRESALRICSTVIAYPLTTLGIGYISTCFFGAKEQIEFTFECLYKGLMPKLIMEVSMVWVSIISRRITVSLIDDEFGQAIICRVPPFILQSLLYPFNVVSTVMADNGRSGMNPEFVDWRQCFRHLSASNQLKRGSAFLWRQDHRFAANKSVNLWTRFV